MINRKKFLMTSVTGVAGIVITPSFVMAQQSSPQTRPTKGPPLDKELVKEFVSAAHKDIDKVKKMLAETPDLLNSVHSWNDWDWEDAIGAAAHMGLSDMANYLLDLGARPTICVAAMLGKLDVVQSFITTFPQMKEAVGPHKISLFAHAKAGGKQAKPVLKYLKSIGIKQ